MPTIHTIGHSTRSLDELLDLLAAHGVEGIADVRRFAGSRRLPHFNTEHLAAELPKRGFVYRPFAALGGRRRAAPDSPNAGWRNAGFRGYADHMQSDEFLGGLAALMEEAQATPLAMMCAEAVPWRCHRSLVGDALLVRGWTVLDIMSRTQAKPHQLTPFAKVDGTRITYPPEGVLPGLG